MEKVVTVSSNTLKQSIRVKDILTKKLTEAGYYVSNKIEKNTELLISIGGDGSFLKTVHRFNFVEIPVIAINTGHLGFLQNYRLIKLMILLTLILMISTLFSKLGR